MPRRRALHLLFVLILGLAGFQGLAAATQSTPDASPVATPVDSAPSCGAPGHHPVVFEGVTAADIEAAGLSGQPIILTQDTTIEAGNGTPITLPAGTWSPARNDGLVFSNGDSTEGISLATGESWTIRETPGSAFDYARFGPWLVGATDDTSTDFWVFNPNTGTLLFASDVFGAPFAEARMPGSLRQSGVSDVTPAVLTFIDHGADEAPHAIVLPSADPLDAWVLDPDGVGSDVNAAIATDGSRLALVEASGQIRVLDGFTGEHITTHTLPEPDAQVRAIGIGSDNTSLLLMGDNEVWAVDIDTGETTTLVEADVAIASITFDPTTGTALVPVDDASTVWLDPASGDVKEVDVDALERIPRPQDGWIVLETGGDPESAYALLDMANGELVTEPISVQHGDNPMSAMLTGGEGGVWLLKGDGELVVLDGPSGRAYTLPVPEENWEGWQNVTQEVSPNGECIIYTRLGSGFETPPGVSWIAPLEPGARWAEIPFEINGWLVVPTGPEVQQAGLEQNATPVPAATPAG